MKSPSALVNAAGLRVARGLAALRITGVSVVEGGTAPENLTAEIRRRAPSHVVVVDAARMGGRPGEVRLIDAADVEGDSFSTHTFPLSVLCGYLSAEIGCTTILVGIEPRSLAFGVGLSQEAEAGAVKAVEALGGVLGRILLRPGRIRRAAASRPPADA